MSDYGIIGPRLPGFALGNPTGTGQRRLRTSAPVYKSGSLPQIRVPKTSTPVSGGRAAPPQLPAKSPVSKDDSIIPYGPGREDYEHDLADALAAHATYVNALPSPNLGAEAQNAGQIAQLQATPTPQITNVPYPTYTPAPMPQRIEPQLPEKPAPDNSPWTLGLAALASLIQPRAAGNFGAAALQGGLDNAQSQYGRNILQYNEQLGQSDRSYADALRDYENNQNIAIGNQQGQYQSTLNATRLQDVARQVASENDAKLLGAKVFADALSKGDSQSAAANKASAAYEDVLARMQGKTQASNQQILQHNAQVTHQDTLDKQAEEKRQFNATLEFQKGKQTDTRAHESTQDTLAQRRVDLEQRRVDIAQQESDWRRQAAENDPNRLILTQVNNDPTVKNAYAALEKAQAIENSKHYKARLQANGNPLVLTPDGKVPGAGEGGQIQWLPDEENPEYQAALGGTDSATKAYTRALHIAFNKYAVKHPEVTPFDLDANGDIIEKKSLYDKPMPKGIPVIPMRK